MTDDGLDQSWGFASPDVCAARGIKVVSMYLSHDPSKNASAGKIAAYHKVGVAVLLNWENSAGAPLHGASQGTDDAGAAVTLYDNLIKQLTYGPQNTAAIPFSADFDTNPSQYPVIDGYYAATKHVLAGRYFNGCYGEFDLIEHLHATGLTAMEWQTLAWSGGRISPEADFYQSSINNYLGGASVDFDRILHPLQLGAWWPPGHRFDSVTPDASVVRQLSEEDDMPTLIYDIANPARAAVVFGGTAVSLANGQSVRNLKATGAKTVALVTRDYNAVMKACS